MALATALVPLGKSVGNVLARSAPAIKEQALKYYRDATNGKVTTIDQAVTYAVGSKNSLATIASGLVASGANPDQIFTQQIMSQIRDSEIAALRATLRKEFVEIYGNIDRVSKFTTSGGESTQAQRRLGAETVSYLRRRLMGSSNDDREIRKLHTYLRLFNEMSEDLLGESLELHASKA